MTQYDPERDYLPDPKPSELGLGMTVCIAAIANDRTIVTASDTKVSIGFSSSETTAKYEGFHDEWVAMMAGNDICHFIPIRDRASENMRGKPNTLRSAISAFKRAYRDYLSEVATDRVLGRYDLDVSSFKKGKGHYFTKKIYQSLFDRIEAVELECNFLVYGFDARKQPHIFAVRHPGTVDVWDKPGFWAVGSGRVSALGMLFHLNQGMDVSLLGTMCNVLFAKYFSEKASDVGESTIFYAKRPGTDIFVRPANLESSIRTAWVREGAPKVPTEFLRAEETMLLSDLSRIRFLTSKRRSERKP